MAAVPVKKPEHLIGDKPYAPECCKQLLAHPHSVELVAPNRKGDRRTQDGWPLHRYVRW